VKKDGIFVTAFASILFLTFPALGGKSTECAGSFCYSIESDLKDSIAKRVKEIRAVVQSQRDQGKAIGYLSIPISTLEGSYFGVNVRIGAEVKEFIEERFGPRLVWILNPAATSYALPKEASGADYMLMWTQVLQGEDGMGADFDFFYFVGPSDFARHFSLDGRADMEKIDAYYDGLAKTDAEFAKSVDRAKFRKYYALRASKAFSYGAHDEWNIARRINENRRAANEKTGIAQQLGIIFDGRAAAPALFDASSSSGSSGVCKR
jgi:hypothetical protein